MKNSTSNKDFNCAYYEEDKCTSFKTCQHNCSTVKQHGERYCHNMFQNVTGNLTLSWGGCLHKDHCNGIPIKHGECDVHYFKKTADGRELFICCCTGNYCNRNYTSKLPTTPKTTTTSIATTASGHTGSSHGNYRFVFYSLPVICTVILVAFLVYLFRRHKRRMRSVSRPLLQTRHPSTPPCTRPIMFGEVMSRGQFGCVWRAAYNGDDVAVKIIQAQEKASWNTERNMFENHSLVHENVLKFYSAEKRFVEGNICQYWIVTQYHGHGSLSDYLRYNLLDLSSMMKLMTSMVNGLTFLHTEKLTLDPPKPLIAHRDFKSRNVLVKDDLSCCISDFGSACSFSGLYELEDTKTQVGTKRYMAPEVLQGAIAFQAEAFLNIDIYALALVMWEILSRCQFKNVSVDPVYQAPYEKEVGSHPTIDDMRTCVLENKLRPILKPEWRMYKKINDICNTIAECWDDEGDARLSAHCVYIRLTNSMVELDDGMDNQSETSSGFEESSFMHDCDEMSSQLDIKDNYSDTSSVIAKGALFVELS